MGPLIDFRTISKVRRIRLTIFTLTRIPLFHNFPDYLNAYRQHTFYITFYSKYPIFYNVQTTFRKISSENCNFNLLLLPIVR